MVDWREQIYKIEIEFTEYPQGLDRNSKYTYRLAGRNRQDERIHEFIGTNRSLVETRRNGNRSSSSTTKQRNLRRKT